MKVPITFYYDSEKGEGVMDYLRSDMWFGILNKSLKVLVDISDFSVSGVQLNLVGPLDNSFDDLYRASEYILSRKRLFLPKSVSCKDKIDYEILEKILLDEHGKSASLVRKFQGGFFGLDFNERDLKYS